MFRAFRVEEEDGQFTSSVREMEFTPLKKGEMRVKVSFSSLNYTDQSAREYTLPRCV